MTVTVGRWPPGFSGPSRSCSARISRGRRLPVFSMSRWWKPRASRPGPRSAVKAVDASVLEAWPSGSGVGEGIADAQPREPGKVAVRCPQLGRPVLDDKGRDVGIVHQVADHAALHDGAAEV